MGPVDIESEGDLLAAPLAGEIRRTGPAQ